MIAPISTSLTVREWRTRSVRQAKREAGEGGVFSGMRKIPYF